MRNDRQKRFDLAPCFQCSQFLVDAGLAPHCYGCDGEVVRRELAETRATAPAGQPSLVQVKPIVGKRQIGI